jgi:nucleotide-binding universal stress UspA family protein
MKRILVPTDFSTPSKASYKFAIDLASRAHGEVHVVHMNELPLLPETTFGIQPYPRDPEALTKIIQAANKAFEAMKKQYPSDVPVYFNTISDYVVHGIQEYIRDNDIELVIMSTHGASNLEEFFIGSTAEKIVRLSPVPVIAIPREIKLETIKRIVFPTTLELEENDLIKNLKELQTLLNAKLHVLLINTPLDFYNEQEATKRLERFAKYYNLNDFTLNFRSHQFERTGILEFMNEIHGDMIAMATHGRTGPAHFFKGSIAEGVLNRIDHPIWTWNLKTSKKNREKPSSRDYHHEK